ncbi:MAG: hypothetical protein WKF30_09465 [Pyrinomonadaceae bacterium]
MITKIFFGFLLLASAGAPTAAAQQTATPPQKPETSTDRTDSHVDKTSTMATVYVYRSLGEESTAQGKIPVFFDGKQVAAVASGRGVILVLDPPMHNSSGAVRGRVGTFATELKRGQKYYLRVDSEPTPGARRKGDPRFTTVETAQGATEVGQLTPIEAADVKDKDRVLTRYPES